MKIMTAFIAQLVLAFGLLSGCMDAGNAPVEESTIRKITITPGTYGNEEWRLDPNKDREQIKFLANDSFYTFYYFNNCLQGLGDGTWKILNNQLRIIAPRARFRNNCSDAFGKYVYDSTSQSAVNNITPLSFELFVNSGKMDSSKWVVFKRVPDESKDKGLYFTCSFNLGNSGIGNYYGEAYYLSQINTKAKGLARAWYQVTGVINSGTVDSWYETEKLSLDSATVYKKIDLVPFCRTDNLSTKDTNWVTYLNQ